jgi:tetratricopeptide (TPR) repeat protein/transcriptional regulator with XRE-family HTH domain
MSESFGKLLRRHRQVAAISQEELAARADLGPQTISLLERGARRFPRPETIQALADALALSPADGEQLSDAARRPSGSQLPPAPAAFTGRHDVLRHLIDHLSAGADAHPAVPIVAIDGMAGAGKTALAIQAAHEIADLYPDGPLFIDLHGFTESIEPDDASAVLARTLRTLGVAGQRIPTDLDQRSALYRTLLAGRRHLIILDNAATAAQVRPLLPGAAGCAVLITSRSKLAGLGTARPVSIAPLTSAEAVDLFGKLAGEVDDPALLPRVVELCGRLPLAVQLVAARYADQPDAGLADLVRRLDPAGNSLAELRGEHVSVAAAFGLSYRQLSPEHQRIFRLMSLNPSPAMDESAVAAAADRPLEKVWRILEDLVDRHLLIEDQPAVYTFHDLLRVYSTQLCLAENSASDRSTTTERLEQHYLQTAAAAMDLLYPWEKERRPDVARSTGRLTTTAVAERWIDRETATLLKLATDVPALSPTICGTIHRHLQARSRVVEVEPLYRSTLSAVSAAGDERAMATATANLGLAVQLQGRFVEARELFSRAVELSARTGAVVNEVIATIGLGEIDRLSGNHQQAGTQYQGALELSERAAYLAGQCQSLVGIGDIQCTTGAFADAADSYGRSLTIARSIGESFAQINAGVGLGDVHYDLGRFDQAIDEYQRALEAAERIAHRPAINYAESSLGNAYWKIGRYQDATRLHRRGIVYARRAGEPVTEINSMLTIGEIHLSSKEYSQASELFAEGLTRAEKLTDRNLQHRAVQGLGKTALAEERFSEAEALFRTALALADELGQELDRGRSRYRLGLALLGQGQEAAALPYLQESRDIFTALQSPELAEVLRLL